MLVCKSCGVKINGAMETCPLCQQQLSGEPNEESGVFPHIEQKKINKNFLVKLVSLVAIAGAAMSLGVYAALPHDEHSVRWWLFVLLGVICAWISVVTAIMKRRNIFKNISLQLFLITMFAVLWDIFTGWHGWSLDYVIPCSCIASMVSMYVLSIVLKIPPRGFVMYLLIDVIYGIVPLVFIFTDILNTTYPSIACVVLSIISISAVLLFQGRSIKDELTRKFHL